jgi:hypothetical protein
MTLFYVPFGYFSNTKYLLQIILLDRITNRSRGGFKNEHFSDKKGFLIVMHGSMEASRNISWHPFR